MPTSLTENIPDGNTIVSLPVTTETTYGNSIFPNNYIDIYLKVLDADGNVSISAKKLKILINNEDEYEDVAGVSDIA